MTAARSRGPDWMGLALPVFGLALLLLWMVR